MRRQASVWAAGRIGSQPENHAETEPIERAADNHPEGHPEDHAASSFERHHSASNPPISSIQQTWFALPASLAGVTRIV
jgi:hypothetical protein